MRKDAKIGFAIGGVLLAVLTVYATVVTKHPKKPNTTVAIVTPVPADNPAPNPTPSPLLSSGDGTSGGAVPTPVTPAKDPAPAHPDALANTNPPGDGSAAAVPHDTPKPDDQKPAKIADAAPTDPVTPDAPAEKPAKPHSLELDVPAPSAPATAERTYIIQPGQTLSSIAAEVYGNPRFWVAIQRENKSINANRLKVGEKINLPDITPLRPGAVENVSNVSDEVVTPPSPRLVGAVIRADAHSYVVKAGDSLYKIARTILGSGRKADALYALNKDVIGPDKSKLKLGMVLKLPDTRLASSAPMP